MLSRLFPLSRLALPRRVPFWAQALILCALFAVAGVAAVDDYGISFDEFAQREIANANVDYISAGVADGLYYRDYRYYGVVIEMPLLLAERALGLHDTRHIYLTRHLLTHLFFIAGGFACGMLAYRMVGSRWIALLAMLMFLLHPRLYAHSFFNSKDVPFAVMLMIALYLTHRAFRRDTVGAFLLCGIVAGLAISLRPFGLMLLPMILAMRALDLWQASGREERMRILATAGIFAAAALATVYIIYPYYWENPLRFIESARALAQHPTIKEMLFMGETYRSDAAPWNYLPVWFAITAPPVALTLGALGCAAVGWQAITRPLAALSAREMRFRILLLGCVALPIVVAIILKSNVYDGWRQMYFLWGPFCLLAAVGLRALVGVGASEEAASGVAARLPGWTRGVGLRRGLAYGVAGFGLITTLTAMAALHPHQQVYFNSLVGADTPGALGKRYEMDYYQVAQRQSLEHLLARYPDDTLRVWPGKDSELILPSRDRERIVISDVRDADFYLNPRIYRENMPDPPAIHSIGAYGSAIAFILAPNSDAYRNKYRAEYDDVEANGTLLARSAFDIYIHNGELYYLSANCAPRLANAASKVFLHIYPTSTDDLLADRREHGFENRDFKITDRFAFFDGKCIHRQILPDYPIARIRTGQDAAREIEEWRADIELAADGVAQAAYDGISAGDYGQPVAQSNFDVYLSDDGLAYLKEPCAAGDADARFFLHIFPADLADLPAGIRERGFENRDFRFYERGARIGDKCVAERELPDYLIERIRTGQFVSGEERLWSVEFPAAR